MKQRRVFVWWDVVQSDWRFELQHRGRASWNYTASGVFLAHGVFNRRNIRNHAAFAFGVPLENVTVRR